jgi:hypothetical protein
MYSKVGSSVFTKRKIHHKAAPDGLDAYEMNLGPGGKQRIMRRSTQATFHIPSIITGPYPTVNYRIEDNREHDMNDANGVPKGIKRVLQERGLWRADLLLDCQPCRMKYDEEQRREAHDVGAFAFHGIDKCCARMIMKSQPDFLAQREWLRETIENENCQLTVS